MSNSLRRTGTPLLNRATPGERQVWFRLVTRDVDRHGTIIEPAGIDTKAFLVNPVFLWMHDSGGGDRPTPPPDVVIGRVVEIDQTAEHFDICCEFDDDGPSGLATTCYRKVKAGYLRAVSIGCNALTERRVMVDGAEVPVYDSVELLECSLVIIGSNRNALKLDRAAAAAMVARLEAEDVETVPADEASILALTKVPGAELPSAASQPSAASAASPIPAPCAQVASVAVFDLDGLMLWGRRNDTGKWTTPGGHMVAGEDPATAALRELREEAGIDAAAHNARMSYMGPVDLSHDDKGLIIHVFRCDLQSRGIVANGASDPDKEVTEWRWVALEDGALPAEIGGSLHAPRNALLELGVCRAIGSTADAGVDALLSDVVDAGVFDVALLEKTIDLDYVDDESDELFGGGHDDSSLAVRAAGGAATTVARTLVPHKSYPTVETAWDAAAATSRWKKWASSDGSGDKDKIDWDKYAQCFLWFDADNRESFGAYKFPHHDIVGGKPVTVWAGIVAAAARIDQAKGIPAADVVKMKAHLAAHYKEFDKVAPWQRRSIDVVQKLHAAATRGLPDAVAARLSPIHNGPAHVPADSDGTFMHAQLTVYALVFPLRKFSRADAVLWAQQHGYTAFRVSEVGDGASEKGMVITENSILLEQLPANVYQPAPFGPGVKWQTIVYPDTSGIACVYGVLRAQKVQYRQAIVTAMLAPLPLTATHRAELRTASSRWTLPLLRQARKLPAHSFAAQAARSLMQQLRDLLAALRTPAYQADSTLLQALNRSCAYSHNRTHYLSVDTVSGSTPTATTRGAIPMKRTPEARNVMRGLIHHALEHADLHARAMEEGHISDEHRAMCHAAALRALDTASELHNAYRAVWLGATPSQEIVVESADVGMEYAMPKLPEGELRNRFAEVVAQVGKLPRSLRSLVSSELGTVDSDEVEIKLTNLKGIAEQFQGLKAEHQRGLAAADKAATEALIEDALNKRLLTPAEARKFRGLDPATGSVVGDAWSKAKVERFLAEREQIGPVASIARPGQERTVEAPQQAMAQTPAKQSLIRFGAPRGAEMSPVQMQDRAAEIAQRMALNGLSINVADILSRTDAAASLPNSESHPAIANATQHRN